MTRGGCSASTSSSRIRHGRLGRDLVLRTACTLAKEPRQPPVLEDTAAGLARRAVEDRVLLEVDLRERRAAHVTRLAEAPVDAVGLLVGGSARSELETALELEVDGGCEARDLLVVEVARQRVRRELRRVEDLVRPRTADARDQVLVAEERMQAPRLAVHDLAEALWPEAERFRAEVGQLGLRRLRGEEPDAGALLLSGLGEEQLCAARELEPEGGRLGRLSAGGDEAEPACGHQVDEQHELLVRGREEKSLPAPLGAAELAPLERCDRRGGGPERRGL